MRKTPPLNIKDPEVYKLARQLADATGETLTATVKKALKERLERERRRVPDEFQLEAIREIVRRIASLPVLDPRTPDEIIGYDEHGVPR
jgi:antitoxin VapB